jgi:magnesium chelatase family protein
MIARRLAQALELPPSHLHEAHAVWSASGLVPQGGPMLSHAPFRAPHHTVSEIGMVGGGSPIRPGELSLAHGGVLMLDELPEFRRNVIDAIRSTRALRRVTLVGKGGVRGVLPVDCGIVAAANPCPCGYHGVPETNRRCTCSPEAVRRYRARLGEHARGLCATTLDVRPLSFAQLREEV